MPPWTTEAKEPNQIDRLPASLPRMEIEFVPFRSNTADENGSAVTKEPRPKSLTT
jgi:hypothetical protein